MLMVLLSRARVAVVVVADADPATAAAANADASGRSSFAAGHAGDSEVAYGLLRSSQLPAGGASRSPAAGQLANVCRCRMNEKHIQRGENIKQRRRRQ